MFVSLLSRLCLRHYRPVEPLLLHPLVRGKEGLEIRHNHPPYLLNPYYGNSRSRFHMTQEDWEDDTHYRWPSPSLPPTLKKGAKQPQHFGTLDKSDFIYPAAGGKINYAFESRGSPDGDFDDEKNTSTSSTNESEVILDDFGDVVPQGVVKKRGASTSPAPKSRKNLVQQLSEEDDNNSWTTEF